MSAPILVLVAAVSVVIVALVAKSRQRPAAIAPLAATGATYFGVSEIESYIRENISEIGHQLFPDDADVTWRVDGFEHRSDLILAEATPDSDSVGYPRFKFGFASEGGSRPERIATYCFEDGAYLLLSTSRRAPQGLPRRLE